MTPFGPIDPQPDFPALERRVLDRWRSEGLFERVTELRKDGSPWIFYEGPPTANGRPGLHHVWARVFKDLFPRFQTMRGRHVPRKGGWDCHGLPVEIEIEKRLGFTHKAEIEEFGVQEFNEMCRESVRAYVDDWRELTERAAVWIDTDDTYWTMSNEYVESVWWLVRQLFDNDLLYEGYRVSPYCPRCGTALSSHELGQPGAYRDVTDLSVYVRFPVVDDEFDLMVWTTTPWTLISNVAAAVGPDIEYVRVRSGQGRDLIVAADLAGTVTEGGEIVARMSGAELVGRRYRRPFDLLDIDDRGQRVIGADFVSTGEGSGIVHLAPAFGADDMDAAKAEDLPVLNPVGPDGRFDTRAQRWAGRPVKETDREIAEDLADRGLLVREEPYLHSYPHCWRCATPLIYWATTSWFVRTSDRKADLLAENERVEWHPEHIKHGRFGDWLENNIDWALSRARYWGTPLPVWKCAEGHATCVASLEELARLAGRDLSGLDLHRPYVDEIEIACTAEGCSHRAHRVEPVLDAWFDSGSMPSAQHHYPFADRSGFESTFPADFICEAVDQTRGWFYSLLAVNVLAFGATPYRNVVCLGLIVDEDGQKMSKSKGNVIDPWHIFDTFGSDALRWYFFSAGSPWSNRRVSENGIREAARKTLLTLWHVFSFFVTYADIEGWKPEPSDGEVRASGGSIGGDGHVLDRWLLERLDATVGGVTAALEDFDALGGSTALGAFVDDLSNWYVRRSRPRFWGSSDHQAFETLHRSLIVTSRLLAPFCPFLADELHRCLTGGRSVHVEDWPDAAPRDALLTEQMETARRLVGLGRSARTDAGIPVRQPLRRALLLHPALEMDQAVKAQILDELNVKALEDVSDLSDLMSWTVVPNFRALGPRLGARVGEVKAALATASGSELRSRLETDGFIEVAGERLGPDDVEIRAERHENFALAADGGWAVALDLELDDTLRDEGVARELARALNDIRKKIDLALTDRVLVAISGAGPRVGAALASHMEWIKAQVLATEIRLDIAGDGAELEEIEVGGENLAVAVRATA